MRITLITLCDTLKDGTCTTCNETVNEVSHLVSSSFVARPLLFVLPSHLFNLHQGTICTGNTGWEGEGWGGEQETVNAMLRLRMLYNLHITLSYTHSPSAPTLYHPSCWDYLWEHIFRLIHYTQLTENTYSASAYTYPTVSILTFDLDICWCEAR